MNFFNIGKGNLTTKQLQYSTSPPDYYEAAPHTQQTECVLEGDSTVSTGPLGLRLRAEEPGRKQYAECQNVTALSAVE